MERKFGPEERDFCLKIVQNPAFNGPVRAFVAELANEGVLKIFIDCDMLVGLNLLLEAKDIKLEKVITRADHQNAFTAMILGHVLVNLQAKLKGNPTEEQIKEALDDYIDNVRWSRVFEIFWGYSFMIADQTYKPYVEEYKKIEGVSQKELDLLADLYRDAFPAEKGLAIPTRRWAEEHKKFRDMFDLALYLKDEYIDEVFGSIQRVNKATITADMREAIDIVAISCVEMELFTQALKELYMSEDKVDEELLYEWLEKVKTEKRLCIMALYYLFAHKSYALLAGKK